MKVPMRMANLLTALSLCFAAILRASADEARYDATITFCGGQKTTVKDFRVVYSWREMPARSEGLTPYESRAKAERGVWVASLVQGKPGFQLIPFSEIEAIEFDSDIQQLGVSEIYQFQIRHV